jgi:hypothetical protein
MVEVDMSFPEGEKIITCHYNMSLPEKGETIIMHHYYMSLPE